MKFQLIRNTLLQIPPEIKYFFLRATVIFIVWKLLYHLVLFPTRFPDKQLTEVTAQSTAFLYQQLVDKNTQIAFKEQTNAEGVLTTVYLNHIPSIRIADACNALGLYVLYVSLLFCFRTPLRRQLIYAVVGCISIFILNGLRCFLLTWMYLKQARFFDFAHHYLFQISVYIFIFFMWIFYIKKVSFSAK
ncbi:MAG: exosortase/archaeosortase family protein [Bacteroidota bacterium]|nr:exosortase/archaeosortase family protein [Bacteroidota bacterium]